MTDQKRENWIKLIDAQVASGQTIRAFCKEHGVADHAFYYWRKRLQGDPGPSKPIEFALLKTVTSAATLELILTSGEHLRIWKGVDAATFRLVLDVVRQ